MEQDFVEISILTQNLYCPRFWDSKKRVAAVEDTVMQERYDVVFFQEALFPLKLNRQQYLSSFSQPGRLGPRGGLVTLLTADAGEIEFQKYVKQGTLFSQQLFDRTIEKGFLVIRCPDVTYINTHLICPYDAKEGTRKQYNHRCQFEQLFAFLEEELKGSNEVIVGGDFNFTSSSEEYDLMVSILQDHTPEIDKGITATYGRNIDFIFSTYPQTKEQQIAAYSRFVSDHPGLVARIGYFG